MSRIESKNHRLGTYEINKISLLCLMIKYIYPKQWVWQINSRLLELIMRKTVILITIQNSSFFCSYKDLILIFGLIRTVSLSNYKDCTSIFGLIRTTFLLFCFNLYEMVDSKYSSDNYNNSKVSIVAIIKDPKMLRFVPDHFKTKKICKNAV